MLLCCLSRTGENSCLDTNASLSILTSENIPLWRMALFTIRVEDSNYFFTKILYLLISHRTRRRTSIVDFPFALGQVRLVRYSYKEARREAIKGLVSLFKFFSEKLETSYCF